MLTPVYGFVQGDTMGVLVLARSSMTIAEVAQKLAHSARLRARTPATYEVHHQGRVLSKEQTVANAGIHALDRIDLRPVTSHDSPSQGVPSQRDGSA